MKNQEMRGEKMGVVVKTYRKREGKMGSSSSSSIWEEEGLIPIMKRQCFMFLNGY